MPRKTKIQVWKYESGLLAIIIGNKTLWLTEIPELHKLSISEETFTLCGATKIYEN